MLNVDTQASTRDGGMHDYGYDGLDHLVQATRPAGYGLPDENYEYDRVGNRETPGNPNQYGYDDNHRITQGPGLTYSYDDDGNQTARSDGASFGYDSDNRLVSYGKAGMAATYVYDPFGRLIEKSANGVTTAYLWDEGRLLGEYDQLGVRSYRYAYLPNGISSIQVEDTHGIYSGHIEHLRATNFLTNAAQQLVWLSKKRSFGVVEINQDPDGDGTDVVFNERFPGQYFSQESGLHYNYYRDYDPTMGRYLQVDPIGLAGGTNIYLYADGNPVNRIDPWGLDATVWDKPFSNRGALNGPRNGNWGGACWSGGQYSCGGQGVGSAPSTDSADRCYMEHDRCYAQCDEDQRRCPPNPDTNNNGYV